MSMANLKPADTLTAADHAEAMEDYIREGTERAMALGNRGPIRLDAAGKLEKDILDAYREHGFYVFESVVRGDELEELRADVDRMLDRAPVTPDAEVDAHGRTPLDREFPGETYRFAKPLSDPLGGTTKNKGRHPVKMLDPAPSDGAPEWTVELLRGNLRIMESALRLYGHPGLLAVAEAVNGPDFVPYNEVTFVKEPGLGPSVAWHQDGTTHWDTPDWDQGAHGFNFMTQLYRSTPGNGVWVLPGSHRMGRIDIRRLVAESGSERIDGAVPLVCEAGDVFILNRQALHGSFANTSPERRVTLNAGFFPRKRVLGVATTQLNGKPECYTEERIRERSRMIPIAIDARRQRFPDERPYCYAPFAGEEAGNRWDASTRETVVKEYSQKDMYI